MTILLFIVTVLLDVISVGSAVVYLWLNNYAARSDKAARCRGLRAMQGCSMAAAVALAFLTSLLSGAQDPRAALGLTTLLYIVIAVSMVVVVITACVFLIIRMISRSSLPADGTGVGSVILIAVIGAVASGVMIWLLL